jgi:hypothetical protein
LPLQRDQIERFGHKIASATETELRLYVESPATGDGWMPGHIYTRNRDQLTAEGRELRELVRIELDRRDDQRRLTERRWDWARHSITWVLAAAGLGVAITNLLRH